MILVSGTNGFCTICERRMNIVFECHLNHLNFLKLKVCQECARGLLLKIVLNGWDTTNMWVQ